MCISPVLIDNPYFRKDPSKKYNRFKDCTSKKIPVPCGQCFECISNKQMQLVQRIQMETLSHHLFFCTLTYNNESLPKLTTSSGYTYAYADVHDLQNMFKRIRKYNLFGRPFKYFAVSERGSDRSRPHFHIIFMVDKFQDDNWLDILNLEKILFDVVLSQWSRNIGSFKYPKYQQCCTLFRKFINGKLSSNYDLHYIQNNGGDSCASVAFYVLKYMLKPSNKEQRIQQALKLNLPQNEYEEVWKKVKSRHIASHNFGDPCNPDVVSYIRSGIEQSKNDKDRPFAKFYNIDTGQSFPLARYYKSKGHIYHLSDAQAFYELSHTEPDVIDSFAPSNILEESDYNKRFRKFQKNIELNDLPTYIDSIDSLLNNYE